MMKRKLSIWKQFSLLFLLMMSPMVVPAQKKEIQTAKDQVKAGKNLDQAVALSRIHISEPTRH